MTPVFEPSLTPLNRGTTLIEASAGTGKTYTITALFLRLLLEEEIEVSQILVTTYTEAATAELRDRIRSRLTSALSAFQSGESADTFLQDLIARHDQTAACALLTRALRGFDQAAIHTIHGFCQRVLRDRALESRMLFDAELLTDQRPLLRELVDDFWRVHFATASPLVAALVDQNSLSPEYFLKLLGEVIPRPLLRIIPELAEAEFLQMRTDLDALYAELCTQWNRGGEALRNELLGPPKWANARSRVGKPERLKGFFETLTTCLGGKPTSTAHFESLLELCQSKIDSACLKGASAPRHTFFELCERYAGLKQPFKICAETYFLAWARRELAARKAAQNVLGFDDLLTRLHAGLFAPGGERLVQALRGRFKAALIDEFQDTDGIQEQIFRRVFARPDGWLYLIGDPKQAIYGFRGADIFTYLAAGDSAGHRFTLSTNRRSARHLVGAVNQIFGNRPGAFVVDGIDFDPVSPCGERDATPLLRAGASEPPFRIWYWDSPEPIKAGQANRELPRATAAAIAELLASGSTIGAEPVHPSQVAVLVAKHHQARAVQGALHAFHVPSVLLSDESVWRSPDARELHIVLAAVAQPNRESLVRAALSTEILGFTVSDLAALQESDQKWEGVLVRFAGYHERWMRAGFIQMFRALLLGERVRSRLLSLPDGDRRLTNLMHLAELLHRAALEQHLASAALLRYLEAQRGSPTPPRDDESVLRLERDDDAVKIITMHRSKGLEFEIVFCPYAWGQSEQKRSGSLVVYHEATGDKRLTLDLGSHEKEQHRVLMEREQLAEEARLLYVALTRAKYQCNFVWGRFSKHEVSAASWLLHGPPAIGENCVAALREHITALDSGRFTSDLAALENKAPECIEVRPLSGNVLPPPYRSKSQPAATAPEQRAFKGHIAHDWGLTSFSGLVNNRHIELPDYDEVQQPSFREETPSPFSIHAFPRGLRTGFCLHHLMERLDFQNEESLEEVVTEALKQFSFDAVSWTPTLTNCIRRVLNVPTGFGFSLSQISRDRTLTEMEFHLPAQRLEAAGLRRILQEEAEGVFFETRRGWLKGFIDLVFEHEGRFYLADWKSNWLGPDAAAYSAENVNTAMSRHRYGLQFHLYAVALHRYLQIRLPHYSYDEHFGGVLYYFVRGIDPANPEQGLHRSRPERETIERFNQWLDAGR